MKESILPPAASVRLQEIASHYPEKKSAIMPALYMAQENLGWLTDEAIAWVADELELAPAHVRSVATFYTMYYKQPVAKYHIQICRTLSCMLCGGKEITAQIKNRLKIAACEITTDGMWSYEEVECLGSCGSAPMVEINDVYFENLTTESLDALMDRIESEQPQLRYNTQAGELGEGLADYGRSQVWTQRAGK